MDQALDAVMSMAVFLTGFLVFSLVYSNALLGVVGEAPSAEAPVKVIRYPHHFSVREVKPGLFEVTDSEGAKGVWARCFVVEPSGDWYVVEGPTPLYVPASEADWIVILSYGGWGFKAGRPVNDIITLYGLISGGQKPHLPFVEIEGTQAYVKPAELVFTPGSVKPYSSEPPGRMVYRRVRALAMPGVAEGFVPLVEEGFSS